MSSASKQKAIACQLESFGVIQISGEDTNKFLQGQMTTNVEAIKPHQLTLSAICNPQGRCVSLFFMAKKEETIYLFLDKKTIENTIANLKKYAVFYKINIEDYSEQINLYATIGQQQIINFDEKQFYQSNWPEQDITIIMQFIDTKAANKNLDDEKTELFLTLSHENDWLYQLAHQGIPWLTSESQSQYLPHNLNLPYLKAVDFKKGCFTGQEVIARMQYKGKLKSHMQLLTSNNNIEIKPMDKIYVENQAAAQVIVTATNQSAETAILALVKDRYLDDKIFRLGSENGSILELIKTKDHK